MLIKDIKFRRIRKLAKKRIKQYRAKWYEEGGHLALLSIAFDWCDTPEGYLFWSDIDEGNYEEAYKLRPDLFKPTKKELNEAYIFNDDLNKDIEARASADAFMRRQPA